MAKDRRGQGELRKHLGELGGAKGCNLPGPVADEDRLTASGAGPLPDGRG